MRCDDVRELLSSYIDRDLDADTSGLVEEHLSGCDDCSPLYHGLRQTVELCGSLEEVEVPEGFRSQVMEMVKARARASEPARKVGLLGRLQALFGTGQRRALAVTAMAIVAVIALNSSMGTLPGVPSGVSTPALNMRSALPAPGASPSPEKMTGMAVPAAPSPQMREALDQPEVKMAPPAPAPAVDGRGGSSSFDMTQTVERQVIRRANLVLEAEKDRFEEASRQVVMIVESFGGFVQDSNTYTEADQRKIMNMSIRVPSDNFTKTLTQVESLGKVQSRSMGTQDVTEQFIDIEANIINKEKQQERLLDILKKATTVDEILKIETELNRLRTEIDSFKGRLRYLKNQVSMSSINLMLREYRPPKPDPSKPNLIKDLWDALVRSTRNIVIFLGQAVPYLAVAWFVWFLVYTTRKK